MRLFSRAPSTLEIDARAAYDLQLAGATLVDVREERELAHGRADGARHIALGNLAAQAMTLPPDSPVLVICASGNRSRRGAGFLRDQGFNAKSVRGGTAAWSRANLPMAK